MPDSGKFKDLYLNSALTYPCQGPRPPPAGDVGGRHYGRRPGPRNDGGQRREEAAESAEAALAAHPMIIDELGFVPLSKASAEPALRGLQPALRAGFHPGHHQLAIRRMDRGLRLGAEDRGAGGPAHPSRPHPGDERRVLQAQAQQGDRRTAATRRTGRRLAHTCAVLSRSQNSGYSTCLRPQVIGQVVHDSSAPVAQLLGAIDRQER